jgi:hypothetical protein
MTSFDAIDAATRRFPPRPDEARERLRSGLARHRGKVIVVCAIAVALAASWLTTPHVNVPERLDRFQVIDSSHLRVTVTLANYSMASATVHCLVQTSSPQRVESVGTFEVDLGAWESRTKGFELEVLDDAADTVTSISVETCSTYPRYDR